MHIEYQVSQKDYVSAAILAIRKGRIFTKLRFYYFCVFTTLWLTTALTAARSGGHWNVAVVLTGLTVIPFMAVILWISRIKFGHEFRRNAALHGVHQLDATESGMRIAHSESETRSTWKMYSKFAENSRVFIVFDQVRKSFITIPKSAMSTEQITELRSLFKASLVR
jgi:YcxB-like protein